MAIDSGRRPRDVVAVIDDSPMARDMICAMVEPLDVETVTYAGAREFLADPHCRRADCLLLDLHMPGMNGADLQQVLSDQQWQVPIIFITGEGAVRSAVDAMQRGALHFLQKPLRVPELLDWVRRALELARRQRDGQRRRAALLERFELLTPREREVLQLLTQGARSKDIAQRLGIGVKTVETYRATLLAKTLARNTVELVRLAVDVGLHQGL
ncbi:MAG TPA: response regulator [Burkholderiaceae bacterium]|nr:response regulator [Burkholderiaceae bacterium]